MTVSEYLSIRWVRSSFLNTTTFSIALKSGFISFQVWGNLWKGNLDVNFVRALLRFARLLLVALVNLICGVKYM